MLLSFSPEVTFVLILFELVLSGLALVVLLSVLVTEKQPASAAVIGTLSAGFALLVAAFATRATYCRLAVCPPAAHELSYYWLLFLSESARLGGLSAVAVGYLLKQGRGRRAAGLTAAAVGLLLLAGTRFSADAQASVQSIVPLTTTRASEAAVLVMAAALMGPLRSLQLAGALMLIAGGRAVAVVGAWRPDTIELVWTLEHLATLIGLVLLALALERESRRASLRFFLRLNLTFIVLASSLIVTVTEIERRQFVELSSLDKQDLAEFLRGHMLHYTNRGEPPEQAIAHPDVTRKVVSEFGRYPDLRRVRVSLRGQTMALSINPDGEIDQQFWTGERLEPPPVSPADFSRARLLNLPIVSGGRVIGRVELDHSLERINERIGWQTQLIFGVFTLFVMVASLVTGMLVVAADRTIRGQVEELERTRRRLSMSERLASIGAVADGVAHEINNPAGVLVARTDYLLSVIQDTRVGDEIRDDLDTIRRQAQRIAKTVKDLLAFTRRLPVCHEVFDVRSVLDSALALVRPLLSDARFTVERRVATEPLPVCGDRDRLEQVFTNLLTNAAQAIEKQGRISVAASPRGDGGVEVVVADTGCGIAPEHLERVFDPFFTTKKPGAGTGLGLSLAYGIVRDHGGTIDVTSRAGVGTEFRVGLPPASACAGEAAQHGPARREPPRVAGPTAPGAGADS